MHNDDSALIGRNDIKHVECDGSFDGIISVYNNVFKGEINTLKKKRNFIKY